VTASGARQGQGLRDAALGDKLKEGFEI